MTHNVAIANLSAGTCAEHTPIETYLLSVLGELDEDHPIIERFARRGIIANFDERAALEVMGRAACAGSSGVSLTICPTMGCNFDCPYCFEHHFAGTMSSEVQDDFAALAGRLLDASKSNDIDVNWFDGEPLLAPDVIESLSERPMALAQERGGRYKADIITNGYLLTQEIVERLAEDSDNDITYYTATVSDSEVAERRGRQVDLLCSVDASEMSAIQEAEHFSRRRGHYCGAHNVWCVGIDEQGNLQKCWEAVAKPHLSFGTAHDWDPARPMETAANPDNLTMFLNTAGPVPDDERRECVWLPQCVGGCPYKRLAERRTCLPSLMTRTATCWHSTPASGGPRRRNRGMTPMRAPQQKHGRNQTNEPEVGGRLVRRRSPR